MRISKTLPALASGLAVAALLAPATASDAAASPAPACTTWQALATPPGPPSMPGVVDEAGVDAVSANDVWFPGMTEFSGNGDSWSLHWDGHTFHTDVQLPPVPPQNERTLIGSSFDSGTDGWMLYDYSYSDVSVFAGRDIFSPTIAARWHDGRWTVTPMAISPDPQVGRAHPDAVAALSPDDAWAAGFWGHTTSDPGPIANFVELNDHSDGALTEHWDGTRWDLVPNPASAQEGARLDAMTVVSPDDVWAVGEQDNSTGTGTIPLAEHWDGRTWSIVPTPPGSGDSSLTNVSGDGPNDVWAVGEQDIGGDARGLEATLLVEHWDGSTWNVVGGLPDVGKVRPQIAGSTPLHPGVYAASPDDVWVTFPGPSSFLHWDGSTWSAVPTPDPKEFGAASVLAGISGTGPGDVWAAGFFLERSDGILGSALPGHLEWVYHLSCR